MSQRNKTFSADVCLKLADTTIPLRFLVPALEKLASATGLPVQNVQAKAVNTNVNQTNAATDVLERRMLFDTRIPRGILDGCKGCAKNVIVGAAIPIIQLLLRPLSGLAAAGGAGFARGGMQALVWSPIMFVLAYVAAAQQLAMGVYVTLFAFKHVAISKQGWNAIDGGYVPYSMKTHPSVASAPEAKLLMEIGASRVKRAANLGKPKVDPATAARDAVSDDLSNHSYYKMLGVSRAATEREIKEAFNVKALELHPDTNSGPNAAEDFDALTKAYKTLSRPGRRKQYDDGGDSGVASSAGDMNLEKRELVRALFGGKAMVDMFGEIRTGIISRRYIDELSFKSDEVAFLNEKVMEDCSRNMLELLADFVAADQDSQKHEQWTKETTQIVKDLSSAGMAPVVLHTAAREISYVIGFSEASAMQRVQLWLKHEVINERKVFVLSRVGLANSRKAAGAGSTKDNMDVMVKALWDFVEPDVTANVRRIAKRILLDVDATAEERATRLQGMKELVAIFLKVGKKFSGADEATLAKLQLAMDRAKYQR